MPEVRAQAEHDSLPTFLQTNLSPDQRARMGLMSFNQWHWTTAAFIETAVAAHHVGSDVTVAFWCDHTPLRDSGWTTSRRIARLTGSHPIDESARDLIQAAGVDDGAFAAPPLGRHHRSDLPPLPEPLTRSAIRQLTYHGSGMGRSILQVHPDFNTPIRDDYEWPRRWINKAVQSYAWVFDQTVELIRQRNLTSLVVFNGRFAHDRAAAAAAESLGLKVLYYDYGGLHTYFDLTLTDLHDWDDLQRRMGVMWDSWGPDKEDIARDWFANRENRSEAGMDVFLGLQQPEVLPDLPTDHQLVVFFSSSGDEIAELDLDWSAYFNSQEEALRTLAEVCHHLPDTTLIVRTHPHMRLKPQDDRDRWVAAVESIGNNIHVEPESPIDSYALMRKADRVITYGSTSGIEAAFRGTPTAVMGPSAYQRLGCVTPIHTVEGLEQWLTSKPDIHPDKALPYGLMMQRRGFNREWLTQTKAGELFHGNMHLSEASPLARKLSHRLGSVTTKWLTAR